jgi:hypothetical protein
MTSASGPRAAAGPLSAAARAICLGVKLVDIGMFGAFASLSGRTATVHIAREHGVVLDVHEPVYPLGGIGAWLGMEPSHFRVTGQVAKVYDDLLPWKCAKVLMQHHGDVAVRRVSRLMVSIDGGAPVPASESVVEEFVLATKFNTRSAA